MTRPDADRRRPTSRSALTHRKGWSWACCLGPAFLLCAGAAHAQTPGGAPAAVYRLDPSHSFIQFEVRHFGASTLRGRLGPVEGHVTLDPSGSGTQASIKLPMATLDTGVKPLDARLRKPEFFDTEAHPVTWFVARRFEWEGAQLKAVRGELTLKGISQGLTLRALRFNCYPHPMLKREVCGGDFEGTLLRSDFKMDFGVPFVADAVRVVVQVEGIRD